MAKEIVLSNPDRIGDNKRWLRIAGARQQAAKKKAPPRPPKKT